MLKKKIKFHTNHIHAHIERAWSRSYCGFVSLLYMFLQTVTTIWEKHLATSYNLSKPVSWHGTLRSVNQVFAHSELQQELETQFTSWRIGAIVRPLNSCIMLDMVRVKDPSFELGRDMGPCSMDLNGKIYSQQFVGLRICGEREREREKFGENLEGCWILDPTMKEDMKGERKKKKRHRMRSSSPLWIFQMRLCEPEVVKLRPT